jgi:hypothetical protein
VTVEEKIQALLEGDEDLVALVPAARIKVPGDWQDLALPYIIHFPVTVEPTHTHDGPQPLRFWPEYQVSVFAATYGEARTVCAAVEALLDGYRDALTDRIALSRPAVPVGDFDTDRKLSHLALGFSIMGALT